MTTVTRDPPPAVPTMPRPWGGKALEIVLRVPLDPEPGQVPVEDFRRDRRGGRPALDGEERSWS